MPGLALKDLKSISKFVTLANKSGWTQTVDDETIDAATCCNA